MRRRSSSRCSRRLMPGSSARSETAVRARSKRSTMVNRGLLAFRGFRARSVYGFACGLLFFDDCFLVSGIDFGHREILIVGPFGGAYRLSGAGRHDGWLFLSCRFGGRRRCGRSFGRELRASVCLSFRCRRFQLFLPLLLLHRPQFLVDRHLEFVACAAELGQQLADLTAYFRQPFGAEEDQCQEEDEDGIAEMHLVGIMIPVRMDGSQMDWQYP